MKCFKMSFRDSLVSMPKVSQMLISCVRASERFEACTARFPNGSSESVAGSLASDCSCVKMMVPFSCSCNNLSGVAEVAKAVRWREAYRRILSSCPQSVRTFLLSQFLMMLLLVLGQTPQAAINAMWCKFTP